MSSIFPRRLSVFSLWPPQDTALFLLTELPVGLFTEGTLYSVCGNLCKYALLYRVIKKSLYTWWLEYISLVHRDFLITLYNLAKISCRDLLDTSSFSMNMVTVPSATSANLYLVTRRHFRDNSKLRITSEFVGPRSVIVPGA